MELIEKMTEMSIMLIRESGVSDIEESLRASCNFIRNKMMTESTSFRRKKAFEESESYVEPCTLAIGTRWEAKKVIRLGKKIYIPRLMQNTFQYISIKETLEALFRQPDFRTTYFEYNSKKQHVCTDLQIQLASDDFGVCNPLGAKASRHNTTPIYMSIRNVPPQTSSKVNNILLVAVCNANDIKSKSTDFNNLWNPILRDLEYLENHGIVADEANNIRLRGTLVQLAFDNLGANTSLGFSGGFSASYYCRICKMPKSQCQIVTHDDSSQHRTVSDYDSSIKTILESTKVNYEETKGVKYTCNLNKLQYFHLITNPTADIMHDLYHGCIPFALKRIFTHCFKNNVFSADQLNGMIKHFNCAWLSESNLPCEIALDKHNIGQSASQMKRLFQFIPFILHPHRNNAALRSVWNTISSLQQIMEIVFSYDIEESDLKVLEDNLEIHTSSIGENFKSNLIPKHHFMLHYPTIIRTAGPLIHFMMMRYESKHQQLKGLIKNTRNFRDINQTIAVRHQQLFAVNGFNLQDNIEYGKFTSFRKSNLLKLPIFAAFANAEIFEVASLRINDYQYRCDFFILNSADLFEIFNVLVIENQHFCLCKKCHVSEFDSFLNSKVIRYGTQNWTLLNVAELKCKETYELVPFENDFYLISSTLRIRKAFL